MVIGLDNQSIFSWAFTDISITHHTSLCIIEINTRGIRLEWSSYHFNASNPKRSRFVSFVLLWKLPIIAPILGSCELFCFQGETCFCFSVLLLFCSKRSRNWNLKQLEPSFLYREVTVYCWKFLTGSGIRKFLGTTSFGKTSTASFTRW